VTRAVVALLVLRVLAAPIASRPDNYRLRTTHRFVARVCTWPAQRPQRSIPVASWDMPRFLGMGRTSAGDRRRSDTRLDPGPSRSARHEAAGLRVASSALLTDRARC
jgi:hypothetical protein